MNKTDKPKRIIKLNELTNHCGYFTENTSVNNGYGCKHPEQDEIEVDKHCSCGREFSIQAYCSVCDNDN